MPNISVKHDLNRAERLLKGYERQIPFATSLAINNTAKDFQTAERTQLLRAFDVRRKQWVERNVKIKPFSTKRRLEARIGIVSPGAGERSDILSKFEKGGMKRPTKRQALAIPDRAQRTRAGVISRAARPRAFRFRLWGVGKGGVRVYRGKKRTFMIQYPDGTGGIYQRVGRRSKRRYARVSGSENTRDTGIRTLFRFTSQARIDERLEFVSIGQRTVHARFGPNFHEALERAMRARGNATPSRQQVRIAKADIFGRDRRS